MAAPVSNHFVNGTVKDRLGNILVGSTVTLTHPDISPVLTTTTGSDGKYILNLSGLDFEWAVGQNITLFSSTQFKGRKSTTVAISDGASQTVNLTMEETSDSSILGTDDTKRFNHHFVTPTTYDQEKVTNVNPLPVNSSNIDLMFNPTQTNTYDSKNRLSTETITLASGDIYKRTFIYTGNAFQFTTRGKWIKQ